jgi:Kef-type K+ transport system membrane component KefB
MTVFAELTLIIVLAAVVAGLMRVFKQPLIIGYILTGIIAGPLLFDVIKSQAALQLFAELGIALLLFIVGVSLSPRVIKEVGKASLLTGLGQIVFTTVIGYMLVRLLGFEVITALYIAVALTFSSTIIILKLLSDKLALEKTYGKISIGFLIVQDIVALLILVVISAFGNQGRALDIALETVFRGVFLVAFLIILSLALLPKLTRFFARQSELLFLFAIAWGMGLATLFEVMGFSLEIGALIAGVALSTSPFSVEVSSRLKSLRDFFLILFFIMLGAQFLLGSLAFIWFDAIILSLFILIGNPLIVMFLLKLLGYSQRTGFLAGLTVAQVSEFSIIIVLLGVRLGQLDEVVLSLVTVVGLITIGISTYLISYGEPLYQKLAPYLKVFKPRPGQTDLQEDSAINYYDAILFGLSRIGYDFVKIFKRQKIKFLVIDFDPVVRDLALRSGFDHRFGDADDVEFLNTLPFDKVKLIVSTVPEFETNALLVDTLRQKNKEAISMVINHKISETLELYKHGASYVILPHFLGGQLAADMVEKFKFQAGRFARARSQHVTDLKTRLLLGQAHPVHEKLR